MKRQTVHVLGGQQHRQNTWAGNAFFNQLSRLVRSDRGRPAVAATVNFTNVLDHTDLHRHDFKLLADFLANGVFAAAAGTRQFMLGKFVDYFDTWQVGRQRLAFAATLGRSDNLFFNVFVDRLSDAFRLVEKG
ncbi:hypothetical protein D3C87_1657140 [compost metagenome]